MKKRLLYTLLLTVLGLNLLVGAQIFRSNSQGGDKENAYKQVELFMRVLERVRQDYVDGEKVSYQDLIYAAMKGMISQLDPHSEFMEPVKYTEQKSEIEGHFGGLGIVIGLRDNILTVVAPMEDTPAFKAGILSGDQIIKIEGRSTEKMTVSDAMLKLRGKPGTPVTISVLRPSNNEVKDHTLERAEIKVGTIKDANGRNEFPLSENKIGYVRITQFWEKTADDFRNALKTLDKQGMEGLVIDLRNNPGGLLDQAVKVCDVFLPRGQLVVSTEGRATRSKPEYFKASGRDEYPKLSIVILVNPGSASASEIVSGCLQDVGRAYIMGQQTFGKGSVQSILPLPDGSALRLTTAKYYTPSHKVIHEKGITPDTIIPMTPEEEEALYLKRLPGGVEGLDLTVRERVKNIRDAQLDRAEDFLKAVILYRDRNPERAPRRDLANAE